MDHNNIIECGGFYFIHNFDSGNLGHVERVPTELIASTVNSKTNNVETPDYEFNLWTRPDCAGTEFENGNRTWFYFGVQPREAGATVRLNLINLNKQGKMYNQGMAPVTRTLPGKPQWERIRDRPIHSLDDNTFTLSFKYRTSENLKATTFFAFTYPFSFAELQIALNSIDLKMLPLPSPQSPDDIYYCRECLIYSLEGRRVDLLTITSHHGITKVREDRLKHLFPESQERPLKFQGKKVIFISARVHPGETPSSFVFNGFLNLLLTRHDPIALALRRLYVFKMIPFLNPDGVARGHYRTDTRGVNLNRVYLNPSLLYHPTVYASRALIRYHHFGCEKEDTFEDTKSVTSRSIQNINESAELLDPKKKKNIPSPLKGKSLSGNKSSSTIKRPSTAEGSKQGGPTVKPLTKEASQLAEQVCELKLRVPSSDQSEASHATPQPSRDPDNSLLDDNTLRSCLGSNVHLSTSEELNFQGNNPLRPLRDALKNSISLLMESTAASAAEGSPGKESPSAASRLRMGWCHDCRRSAARLHDALAAPASLAEPAIQAGSPTYRTIDEYRKHQKEQLDDQIRDSHLFYLTETERDAPSVDAVYFCTNCFKRYIITENNEEIKLVETVSTASVAVSAGDSGDIRSPPGASPRAGSGTMGDSAEPMPPPPPKEDKSLRHKKKAAAPALAPARAREPDSGLFLYIDLHGHASKKGIFMYGNHFEDMDASIECMLLPRIMSLNNLHFHFSSCNFTERNMYLKDRRDGMSREGSGRVAVLKATGLVRSYTLECNYNTGRLVNVLPPPVRDAPAPAPAAPPAPPKYTPHIFEEVGRSLGASILDLTAQHPNSRVPCSEHRNLGAVREWLRAHTRTMRPQLTMSRLRPKTSSPPRAPLYARAKGKAVDERKENTYAGAKADERRRAEPPAAPRYLEPDKPKALAAKRRNVLAVRKPNSSKTQLALRTKPARRSADDTESPRPSMLSTKLSSKRSFSRSLRSAARVSATRCRAMASSSSDDTVGWEEAAPAPALAGRRRPFPTPPPARLKKIRLKTAA